MVYGVGAFYFMFYLAMGMVMTWRFFWWMMAIAFAAGAAAWLLMKINKESGKGVFVVMAVASFFTVILGGWSREAARPRFQNRISAYDNIYVEEERQANQFQRTADPDTLPDSVVRARSSGDFEIEISSTEVPPGDEGQAISEANDLENRDYVPIAYTPSGYSFAAQLFTDTEHYGFARRRVEQ
jgi:hypothetical protein